ncbi:MAG: hypothetical protein ABIK83_05805 [Candidatus Zixiibacteriota bacterium]
MIMKRACFAIMTGLLLIFALNAAIGDGVPMMINYQGCLTDELGAPLDTTIDLTFSIYMDSTSAVSFWSETHTSVVVEEGLFNVRLGSGSPIPEAALESDNRWLGISVGDDPEIVPRSRLVAAPYAIHALRADSAGFADVGGGWTDDGTFVRLTSISDNVGIGTTNTSNKLRVAGSSNPVVYVEQTGSGRGVWVHTNSACGFVSEAGNHGLRVISAGGNGLYVMDANGDGVRVDHANGLAGYFGGDVDVIGNLSKGGGSFKIDHPIDPANKFLFHSFVESPDMMNIYNGNVTLDAEGAAIVHLPDYFDALNRDFRYQLTPIGAPAPELHVAQKVEGSQFAIAGGVPGLEVSWQITGIREDPYAEANRIQVEVDKQPAEQGKYLHPGVRGLGEEYRIGYDDIQRLRDEDERIRQQSGLQEQMNGNGVDR